MGPQTNGHAPSTEEESSNETPAVTVATTRSEEVPAASKEEPGVAKEDGDAAEDDEKRSPSHAATGDGPHAAEPEDRDNHSETSVPSPPPGHAEEAPVEASRAACVNGNESMDSVDSGSLTTSHGEDAQQRPPEADEHKEKHSGEPSQERHLQDGRAAVAEKIQDQDDGSSEANKCGTSLSEEELKEMPERPETPQPPRPPVVVDHQRLLNLLDLVVQKSAGYSLEQLERLYALLSQCIYQHRREYDKSQLLEEMEEKIQLFKTFL